MKLEVLRSVYAKPLIQAGIALIFLAIVAFTYRGGDLGGVRSEQIWLVRAGVDALKSLALSPLSSALVLAAGIGLVALGVRKSA